MVGSQQHPSVGGSVLDAMAKYIGALALEQAASLQIIQVGIESDLAQRHYHAKVLQGINFAIQKRSAVADFFGSRLVLRRGAAHRGGDVYVSQFQAVSNMSGRGLRGEAG